MTDATLPITCGQCGYYNPRPGTNDGLCMNSKCEHYGHMLQSWHPVPWNAVLLTSEGEVSEVHPAPECYLDEDDCDCEENGDCYCEEMDN